LKSFIVDIVIRFGCMSSAFPPLALPYPNVFLCMLLLLLLGRIARYVLEIERANLSQGPTVSFVEFFAGEAAVSKGMQLFGFEGRRSDLSMLGKLKL